MRIVSVLGLALCFSSAGLQAQTTLQTSRAVYVERLSETSNGRSTRAIEPATSLRTGDKVVLLVEWNAAADARELTVASAVPRTLAFQRSSKDSLEVSVDGGRNWGQLGTLRVQDGDGIRLVSPEDVTHVRWRVPAREMAAGRNRITYSAIVR